MINPVDRASQIMAECVAAGGDNVAYFLAKALQEQADESYAEGASRMAALEASLSALLKLPVATAALGLLARGIGTATPLNAWLVARNLLKGTER